MSAGGSSVDGHFTLMITRDRLSTVSDRKTKKANVRELTGRRVSPSVPGRLVNAWYDTPTKWYPLHIGVGSLLLVSLHWRKRRKQALEDAEAAQNGLPSVRVKGPWQVGKRTSSSTLTPSLTM